MPVPKKHDAETQSRAVRMYLDLIAQGDVSRIAARCESPSRTKQDLRAMPRDRGRSHHAGRPKRLAASLHLGGDGSMWSAVRSVLGSLVRLSTAQYGG
jgi:hypothetical protein